MRKLFFWFVLSSATLVFAADKKLPLDETSNELVDLSATPLVDRDQIRQELGVDPGPDIVVVKVKIRAVSDKPVTISHDDFQLVSDKDGQHSQPFEPSQIAGSSTLVVTNTAEGGKRTHGFGGFGGIGIGSVPPPSAANTKVESRDSGPQDNPVLAALKAKILPEKEITDSASGLLYFEIEGKVKTKDLELFYKTPAGKLGVRFR